MIEMEEASVIMISDSEMKECDKTVIDKTKTTPVWQAKCTIIRYTKVYENKSMV